MTKMLLVIVLNNHNGKSNQNTVSNRYKNGANCIGIKNRYFENPFHCSIILAIT